MLQRLVTDKILVELMIKKQKEIYRLKPKPSEAESKNQDLNFTQIQTETKAEQRIKPKTIQPQNLNSKGA